MKPDAIIAIRFKTTGEGGRQGPLLIADHPFGCPVFIDGEAFDCRFVVRDQAFELGATYEIPIKFLRLDLVASHLRVGKVVTLWEGKEIGSGQIVRIESQP